MEPWPPNLYQQEGRSRGIDDVALAEAIRRAHVVQNRGLPAILSLGHLAERTATEYSYLRSLVARSENPYRTFAIRKKPRGYRLICVPSAPLLRVQRWLNRYVLGKLSPHASSQAYAPHCSPGKCANMHVGARWLIKIDIRQFFESIDERQVYAVYNTCGYEPLVAFELARLSTRIPDPEHRSLRARWAVHNPHRYSIREYRTGSIGHLPQGAPTSPMLANLAMRRFDEVTQELARVYGLTYTRYSDDLTFSTGSASFGRSTAEKVITRMYGVIRSFDLEPHSSKTNIVPPGARRIVLGLTIDGDRPRLRREFRRMLECHVHYITRFGYTRHAHKRRFSSALGLYRYLEGLIAYACQVDPAFGHMMRDKLAQIERPF